MASIIVVLLIPSVASALSPEQKKLYQSGVKYFDICGEGGSSGGGSVATGSGIPDADIPGKDNREKIWNYLRALGLNPIETAGIVGNIGAEGVYDPQSIEDGNEKVDPDTGKSVGRTKNYAVFKQLTTSGQDGFGLIGFTPGYSLMKPNIGGGADWSGIAKVKVTEDNFYLISTQLDVVYGYMKESSGMLNQYKRAATNTDAAALSFMDLVENPGVLALDKRGDEAKKALNDFKNNPVPKIDASGGGGGSADTSGGDYKYIKKGKIPKDGLKTGASIFGGSYSGGKWTISNQHQIDLINSGKKTAADYDARVGSGGDDNGLGNGSGSPDGKAAYAELSNGAGTDFSALGDLPQKTKLEITYKDKSIIAEKLDVGSGGGDVKGKPRTIDLWWEAARLLDFKQGTDLVTLHVVPDDTPTTSVNGTATDSAQDIGSSDSTACCASGDSGTQTVLSGDDAKAQIWNFFIQELDLTDVQAAGFMGNIQQESNFDPNAINEIGATGIVQWLFGRKIALENLAASKGKPVTDLGVQLEYLKSELEGSYKSTVLTPLKNAKNIEEATRIVLERFEIPCNPGVECDPEMAIRVPNAKKILEDFGGTSGSSSSSDSSSGGCGGDTGGDAKLEKTITVSTPGKYIKMPRKYSCPGHTTEIDSRIAAALAYLIVTYNMCATDGLSPTHLSHGAGLGVDLIPKKGVGSTKKDWIDSTEAAARAIGWYGDSATDPQGSKKSCAYYDGDWGKCMHVSEPDRFPKWMRWMGYNGATIHGDPWHIESGASPHLHLGWDTPNNDGTAGEVVPPRDSVYTFEAPIPDDLKDLIK